MAADERFHVGWAVNAGKIAVEHELGDTRRGFDLRFEDVGLQWVEEPLFQQCVRHLIGDGMCGLDWASLKSQRPDWIRNKTANILAQINLEPEAELSALGVPQIWKFIKSEGDKKAVELIISQQVFGRPYLAPPGVATEPIKILRDAFSATMQDKEFLADAERTRIDVEPSSGERVQRLVEQLYATPQATVERAKEAIKP